MTSQLFLGDCLEIMPTLEGGSVDAVITDPPYGISYASNPIMGKNKNGISNHEAKQWDETRVDFIGIVMRLASVQIIFGGNYYNLPPSRGWVIWYKPDSPPSMADAEMIWTNQDCNTKVIRLSIAAVNQERVGHPTQKPLKIMKWLVENYSQPGATILDPFMGSGTTGVACAMTGRNFIGIEIDPEYFKIAQRRIHDAEQQPLLFSP